MCLVFRTQNNAIVSVIPDTEKHACHVTNASFNELKLISSQETHCIVSSGIRQCNAEYNIFIELIIEVDSFLNNSEKKIM